MLEYFKRRWAKECAKEPVKGHDVELELNVTRLMVSMMKMDDIIDQRERDEILHLLGRRFDLSRSEAEKLLQEVARTEKDAPRFYQIASQIKARYSKHEVAELLGEVWAVAEADGRIDFYEQRYISRISSLLGVSSHDLNEARMHYRPA